MELYKDGIMGRRFYNFRFIWGWPPIGFNWSPPDVSFFNFVAGTVRWTDLTLSVWLGDNQGNHSRAKDNPMIVARVNITSDQMVIIALLFFVMIKIIWLFGLPYAMTYEYLKYRKTHGWSIMPLFEFPPLLLAIFAAYKTNQEGLLSPLSIALWGFGLSLLAHLHLLFIWPIIGIVCIKILKIRPPDEPEECDKGTSKQSESDTQP